MKDPLLVEHIRGTKTPIKVRVLRDGSPLAVPGTAGSVWAGIQSAKSTAASSAAFKRFPVTVLQPLTGVLSATLPHTGVHWTGASEVRVFLTAASTGAPRTFLGAPIQVRVRELSANWVT